MTSLNRPHVSERPQGEKVYLVDPDALKTKYSNTVCAVAAATENGQLERADIFRYWRDTLRLIYGTPEKRTNSQLYFLEEGRIAHTPGIPDISFYARRHPAQGSDFCIAMVYDVKPIYGPTYENPPAALDLPALKYRFLGLMKSILQETRVTMPLIAIICVGPYCMFWPLQDNIYNKKDVADDPLTFVRRTGSISPIFHIMDNRSKIVKTLEDMRDNRETHYHVKHIDGVDGDDIEGLASGILELLGDNDQRKGLRNLINLTSRIADKFHLVPPDTVENTDPRASQIYIYQAGIH